MYCLRHTIHAASSLMVGHIYTKLAPKIMLFQPGYICLTSTSHEIHNCLITTHNYSPYNNVTSEYIIISRASDSLSVKILLHNHNTDLDATKNNHEIMKSEFRLFVTEIIKFFLTFF